jgi:hypothetical protein
VRQFRLTVVALVAEVVRLVPSHATCREVPAAIVWSSGPEEVASRTTANDTSNARVVRTAKKVTRRFSRKTRIVVGSDPTTR